ncbi:glycerophosphodiester phosphodiesterase [Niallia sp. Krafla_26]|uniref:glycerophosphodiester phosphodiesterase n=1 Tax=Niallia sp. Krafla_26 TaxID=3064703 RepID=UPI003D179C42
MKKSFFGLFCLCLCISIYLFLLGTHPNSTDSNSPAEIVAHRGASGYAPENTLAAFDLAVTMNADYIEIDVQRSKDGKLVVIHDTTVNRTTNGVGYVKDLTYEELYSLDAGRFKGEHFTGIKIPTLEEVLDRYAEKIGIFIELKSPELYPGIEETVAKILKKRRLDQNGNIIIQSFNFESMKKMNKLLPKIPIGILTANKAHTSEQALEIFSTYADYFNPRYDLLTEELVRKIHNYNMKIASWTVKKRGIAEYMKSHNLEAIVTDFPDFI